MPGFSDYPTPPQKKKKKTIKLTWGIRTPAVPNLVILAIEGTLPWTAKKCVSICFIYVQMHMYIYLSIYLSIYPSLYIYIYMYVNIYLLIDLFI